MPQRRAVRKANGQSVQQSHTVWCSAGLQAPWPAHLETKRVSDETTEPGGQRKQAEDERSRRLAEELRANLKRRKAQARSRRAGAAISERQDSEVGDDE